MDNQVSNKTRFVIYLVLALFNRLNIPEAEGIEACEWIARTARTELIDRAQVGH